MTSFPRTWAPPRARTAVVARPAAVGPALALAVLLSGALAAPGQARAQGVEVASLFVTVVVDQLRPDQLERFSPAFTGGLKRLLDHGYRFTQASHAHARTSTAPGHATLTTGVFPSRHGLVANSWQQRIGFRWQPTYAGDDADSPILGFETVAALGGRSPKTMLREGLPDWFGAADSDARRVAISMKDRAAVPLGGQNTEHVYWLLGELGRFITSTYYRRDYPGWVDDFNRDVMPDIMASHVWDTEVPEEYRGLARPDEAAYEGDGVHTAFPHVSAEENAQFVQDPSNQAAVQAIHNLWALEQPRSDRAVLELAKVAVDELDLGQRDERDYLAVSLSASDRVGHAYGPFSQEQFSTLVHLDRVLGDFFDYLDAEVGEGRWIVGFTSDHGAPMEPEYARERGNGRADRILRDEMIPLLEAALQRAAQGGGTSPPEVAARLAREVERLDEVERAYTHAGLTVGGGEPVDSFTVLYRNSYYPGRAWDDLSRFGVDLRWGEDDYVGSPTGINHESPYFYDRHVPMIFMGTGIEPGVSDAPVYTVDFAPTLAALAGVPVPDDLDGRRIF